MEHVVTQQWLREHLDDDAVRAVDCRFVLGQPGAGYERYLASHIAGAAHLDVDGDLAGPVGDGTAGRHPLPQRDAFEAAARRAGINDDTFVVAYDEGRTGGAARLWWLLRHFRHRRVAILAGGFDAWAGPTRSGPEDIPPGDLQLYGAQTHDVATAQDLLMRGRGLPGVQLIDARAPERFRGEVEPIDPVPGHIPGARNVPFTAPLPDDLVATDDEVVVYCGSGVTACVVIHDLAVAGKEAKLYPGSYSEWSTWGLPVEGG